MEDLWATPSAVAIRNAARPEIELLLACARTEMAPSQAMQLKRLLQQELDWAYLLWMARKHRLRPLLYQHLNAICPEAVPETTLNQLRQRFEYNCRRNLLLTGELLKLVDHFAGRGIPAVPYKGPALALDAYGNLALRECGDLDILVRTPDVLHAADLLKARGYQREFQLGPAQEAAFLHHQYHHWFWRSENRVAVEIHWGFDTKYLSFPLDPDSLWPRLRTFSLGDRQVSVYSPEDLFLLLCIHGTKHLWEQLRWVCDLAEMVRVHQEMDWDRIVARARESRSERMLRLGILLAHQLLGASFPADVIKKAVADSSTKALAERVERRLASEDDNGPRIVETALFHLRARERWRDKVRYGFGLAATPTSIDWGLLQLPSTLSPLYSVIRLIRLAAKYSLGRMSIRQKS